MSELVVRGLGVIYAIAFASLAVQVIGLIGARGIVPAKELSSANRRMARAASNCARDGAKHADQAP